MVSNLMEDEGCQKHEIQRFLGYNQSIDEQHINPGETHNAPNMVVKNGNLEVTLGNTKFIPEAVPGGIETLMVFNKRNTDGSITQTLLAASQTVIYKWTGTEWVVLKTGILSGNFSYINYEKDGEDIVILSNGMNPPFKWDGSSFDVLGGSPPLMGSISLHYDRVWGTRGTEPDRAYFSDDLDPENWEQVNLNEGGFIDFPTWDGGRTIGLSTIFDEVVIFKSYNLWKVVGTYPGEYEKRRVFSPSGAIAARSIVDAGDKAFFLARDGIYHYDGMTAKLISGKVKDVIANMNRLYADKAVAVFYDNRYILALPEGGSMENNMIVELDIDSLQYVVKKGFNVNSFLLFGDKLLFSNDSGYVMEYDKGEDFDGAEIVAFWETPESNLFAPDVRKRNNIFYGLVKGSAAGSMEVESNFDGNISTIDLTFTPVLVNVRKRLRNRGRNMKFKFSNVNGSRFSLKCPQFHFDVDVD